MTLPSPRRLGIVATVTAIATLAVALVVGGLVLTWLQRSILFPRAFAQTQPEVRDRVPGLEPWWLDSPEGRVEAWLLPGDGVSAAAPGPAVIFAHGNGEVIDNWGAAFEPYRRRGVSVLLPEYRGYGRSAGEPTEATISADFVAFHDRLLQDPRIDRARLVLHGRSLGGGAVCRLAAVRPPAALILQSTFTSVVDIAKGFFVPGSIILDPFDNLSVVRSFSGPTFVLHGTRDSVVPYRHGEALRAAAQRPTFFTYEGDHNDDLLQRPDYWAGIFGFLEKAGILTPRP